MTTAAYECRDIAERMGAFVERSLPPTEFSAFKSHLRSCRRCRASAKRCLMMEGMLHDIFGKAALAEGAIKTTVWLEAVTPETIAKYVATSRHDESRRAGKDFLSEKLQSVSWWGVSLVLHVLVIALASLISMSLNLPKGDSGVVMLTQMEQAPTVQAEPEKPNKNDSKSPLESKHDTPPTDPIAQNASDIVVPPDILAKAELGDHFETIDPDRPDTHSAFGNPDSHFFYSVKGNDEPEGGGGQGGVGGLGDLIGIGGQASKGSGGGWGGGNGTGIGVGNGSGKGSFGNRNGGGRKLMVMRHGGSKATESAVDLALQWLAAHQEPDGHWDSCKYGAKNFKCDTAMTGLALLAFLGAGHTEKVGAFKDNVKRAVAWCISMQAPNGVIYDNTDTCEHGYGAAMATMAMAEAAGMARVKETKEAAQKAVDYCTEIHQQGEGSEKGAWRYAPKSIPDISVSGWFVMALKSAKVAGLHVNPASFEGAMKFIDSVTIKADNAGVDTGYGPASRYTYQPGREANARRCAIGNLCRQFMGWDKEKLQSSVELFVKEGGVPIHDQWKTDLYYWYYGTLCVFQQGGDVWKRWNEAMKKVLTDSQCRNGDEAGSWSPFGAYSEQWGRVGQTALSVLCMEVYYRYAKLSCP